MAIRFTLVEVPDDKLGDPAPEGYQINIASIAAWHRQQEAESRAMAAKAMSWGREDSYFEIDFWRERADEHARMAEVLEALVRSEGATR